MIRSVGATWAHKGRVGAGICKEVVATPERRYSDGTKSWIAEAQTNRQGARDEQCR